MLSVEEMREKIRNYCVSRGSACVDCPLRTESNCYNRLQADAKAIEKNYETLLNSGVLDSDNKEVNKIHLNGYIFDSLIYRYQLARERQLMWEIVKENTNPETARHRYGRDVMKFREILEEVIGEHD